MTATGLLVLALVQPAYSAQSASVAASTAAAVSASTQAAAAAPAPAETKPAPAEAVAPAHPIAVHIHKEAADWEPVSVRAGGDAAQAVSRFTRRVKRSRKKDKDGKVQTIYKGQPAKVKAFARVYPVKDDRMLVISIFPAALRAKKKHLEIRYLIVEGFLEEVKVAAVSVKGAGATGEDDSFALGREGIDYNEEFPASGRLRIAAINPRPGKATLNAASLELAEFTDRDLGFVNLGYSVKGVSAGRR